MIAEVATKADVGVLFIFFTMVAVTFATLLDIHITAAKREILKAIEDLKK